MSHIQKYLPIFVAFAIGSFGAAAYAVHAQSVSTIQHASRTAVVASQQIGDGDGETADDAQVRQTTGQDPQHLDGETNDDAQQSAAPEVENGAGDTGSDASEVETAN